MILSGVENLRSYALPLAVSSRDMVGATPPLCATAGLLWVDRPFAVTSARHFLEFRRQLQADPNAQLWLGDLRLSGTQIAMMEDRLLCLSEEHDLVTLRLEPDELGYLGEEAAFFSPEAWPPRPVEVGEELLIPGYAADQWPACSSSHFRVEAVDAGSFRAQLISRDMPARMAGLEGAPCFRLDPRPEFVGIISESIFHNQVIHARHAAHLDHCGFLKGASSPVNPRPRRL